MESRRLGVPWKRDRAADDAQQYRSEHERPRLYHSFDQGENRFRVGFSKSGQPDTVERWTTANTG